MASDPIRDAVAAAGEAVRKALVKPPCCMEGTGCEMPPCHCSQVAASAAVAAFLRALPNGLTLRWGDDWLADVDDEVMEALAAAVDAAAKGDEG